MGGKSSKPKDKKPVADKKTDKKVDNKKKGAEPLVLKDEEINKILSNTQFSRDAIVELHKDFAKECPTGKLDKKNFAKLFKSAHPLDVKLKSKPDKYCDFAFNAYDRNHDGIIDFEEFLRCIFVTTRGDAKQKVQFAFRHFDADRDGKINKNDLLKVVSSVFDLNGVPEKARGDPKKKVEEIMKKLDVNKKNSVTEHDFVNACLNDQSLKEYLVDPFYSK